MDQGYVIFKYANILHAGVDLFRDSLTTEQYHTLQRNGYYLARNVFYTTQPKELNNVKLYFTEKYKNYGGSAYLVNIRGNSVLIENLGDEEPYEENYVIPDHLFEIE